MLRDEVKLVIGVLGAISFFKLYNFFIALQNLYGFVLMLWLRVVVTLLLVLPILSIDLRLILIGFVVLIADSALFSL